MSKKTLNKIFDEKINKEEIMENVLNKVNKHSVDYFKVAKIGILVGCLIFVIFLGVNERNDKNLGNSFIKEESPSKHSDMDKIINDSQYAFVGLVTEDKDDNDYYKVVVYDNIKGELVKTSAIEIKVDNVQLDVTSIYLFTARLENNDLVIKNEENASLLGTLSVSNTYDSTSSDMSDEIKEKIKEVTEEYSKNVDDYVSDKELSKYDVNYKE